MKTVADTLGPIQCRRASEERLFPDAQARQILTRAVEAAAKTIYSMRVAGRADRADRYYTDRQWLNVWAGTHARRPAAVRLRDGVLRADLETG